MLLRCYQICLVGILSLLAGCGGQAGTVALPTPSISAPVATPTILQPVTATPMQPTATKIVAVKHPLSVGGAWIGGFQLPGGSPQEQKIPLRFTESNGQLQGWITNPFSGASEQLSSISGTAEAFHFEWRSAAASADPAVRFDGRVSDHTISGMVHRGDGSGQFAFVRLADMAESEYLQFAGTYRFDAGRAIGFYETHDPKMGVFATPLVYADLQSGDLAAAFPISGTSVGIGPAVGLAYPFAGEVTFLRDAQGAVSGLRLIRPGLPEMTAAKVALGVEEVRYPGGSGDVTLAGRLISPATPGKHPAVVLVHGAGRLSRRTWLSDMLSAYFALHGIATLSYDKRGAGESGGIFVDSASAENLRTLAQDALAGLAYLKSRQEIDSTRIGMQGSSQAGWIIPLAASLSDEVAFMILWSGPGVTQGITDLYDHRAESTNRDTLTQLLRETQPFGFDPIPYLARTSAPGFWAYGALDMTVPVPESIANLEQVKAAGKKDFTWQVFPTGDHYLWDGATTGERDLRFSRGLVPGLLDQMRSWLQQHVHVK